MAIFLFLQGTGYQTVVMRKLASGFSRTVPRQQQLVELIYLLLLKRGTLVQRRVIYLFLPILQVVEDLQMLQFWNGHREQVLIQIQITISLNSI
jgi:hypothetical protein